jgi:ABC-type transporter Mla MlaB component
MPYEIHNADKGVILELTGGVTARVAGELAKQIASSLTSADTIVVHAREVDDIDTSILQILVSLRKTVAGFELQEPSDAFLSSLDRCALRRELPVTAKEPL